MAANGARAKPPINFQNCKYRPEKTGGLERVSIASVQGTSRAHSKDIAAVTEAVVHNITELCTTPRVPIVRRRGAVLAQSLRAPVAGRCFL